MKYVILNEKLKTAQLNTLKKFTEAMLNSLLENESIYVDGIGTFYLKRNNNKYSHGYDDELSVLFIEGRAKNSKKFSELKSIAKSNEIIKLIKEYLKEEIILDVIDFGIFTSKDSITFTESKSFKKLINSKSNKLLASSYKSTKSKQDMDEIVEYIGDNDNNQAYDDKIAEKKMKDYEELEEIVYDDYINKKDYSKLNTADSIFSDDTKSAKTIDENVKYDDRDKFRNILTNNVDVALKNDSTKRIGKPKVKKDKSSNYISSKAAKIFIIIASLVVFASCAFIVTLFVATKSYDKKNRINVNESIYSIVDSFFRTYESATLNLKLTKDMYLWEISAELYDSPLYWPIIYGENIMTSNPAAQVKRGTVITYRDLKLKGKYFLNISHKFKFNKILSRAYMALYPVFLDNNEKVHALWALRLSSYFDNNIFQSYRGTINKDLYNRVLRDTKNYAKRSI